MIPKKLLLLFLLLVFTIKGFSNNSMKYSEVKIFFSNRSQLIELSKKGLPLDDGFYRKEKIDFSLTTVLDERDLRKLQSSGMHYEITTDDVIEKFRQRPKITLAKKLESLKKSDVKGFKYGSMAGFLTFDEVVMELDSMHLKYPDLITSKDSIGQSIEGRAIWMVKISDNPVQDEDEPELLFTGLHHAREPEGMMALIYFMYYLLENYGTDEEATYLVNNRELYFVPVVNPDGYVYNQTRHPDGGGMWRKNRRRNSDGSFGVDLNRNYGYKWGYDDWGSSPYPSDLTYRGTAPFSEPETQAIKELCESHNFILALNYHTYSNLLIYPWGYERGLLTPDSTIFIEYSKEMTKYNHYVYGTGDQTVGYITNGDSDDWMYGEQITKNKIFAMTPEVGGPDDGGFWPFFDRILPLAQENLYPNLFLSWVAGGFLTSINHQILLPASDREYLAPGDTGKLVLQLKNIGQEKISDASVKISPLDSSLRIIGNNQIGPISLAAQQIPAPDTFSFAISPDVINGTESSFIVQISQNGFSKFDTLSSFVIGYPETVFFDDIENGLDNWVLEGTWQATVQDYHSPYFSLTDSPGGPYGSNVNMSLTFKNVLDLSEANAAFIEFWTTWQIEPEWDFAQVYASADSVLWYPLSGLYTKLGAGQGVQEANEPGYDGFQDEWVKERISLKQFVGQKKVRLRFTLKSDSYVEYDGWHIDDVKVIIFRGQQTGVNSNSSLPFSFFLEQNYPNPFNPETIIYYSLQKNAHIKLVVYNALGQQIKSLVDEEKQPGRYSVKWNGRNKYGIAAADGIYFFKLIAEAADGERYEKTVKGILLK